MHAFPLHEGSRFGQMTMQPALKRFPTLLDSARPRIRAAPSGCNSRESDRENTQRMFAPEAGFRGFAENWPDFTFWLFLQIIHARCEFCTACAFSSLQVQTAFWGNFRKPFYSTFFLSSSCTSLSFGGFRGRGKREIAIAEHALAKRTRSSSFMP